VTRQWGNFILVQNSRLIVKMATWYQPITVQLFFTDINVLKKIVIFGANYVTVDEVRLILSTTNT